MPFMCQPEHLCRSRPRDDRDLVQRVFAREIGQHAARAHRFGQCGENLRAASPIHE